MPEEKSTFTERLFQRFGYTPIRDVSQTHADLAETLQWEQTPAKTLDYLETYEKAIWTYSSVYRIATAFAKVPFRIYRKRVTKKGQRTEILDHLVNHVLTTPNPYSTRFDLWEATTAFAELTGNSYWELVSEGKKPPEEIYVLRPDRIEIKSSKKRLVENYQFEVNGRKVLFLPEDILHFKYFSSISDLYGTSASASAEKSVILDLYALQFNAQFFKAGARLMGTLETDRHLSDKAFKRLEGKWIGRYGGVAKSFKTAVLEEGLKYKPIASTHTDMEFIEQRKMTREEVLAAYGVPPAIVGLFEYANYANSLEQKRLFWEDTMVPKLKKVEENVSSFFLPRYGPRLVGEFDLSVIQALQESEEAKQKIACGLTDSGIMTRNESRHEFYQLDPVDGGDKITIRGKYITLAPEEGSNGNGSELDEADLRDLVISLRKRIKERSQ